METVSLGFIGLGKMAGGHLKRLKAVHSVDIKVAAVCDVNADAVRQFGDSAGVPEGKRYTDYRELINDPDVQAVVSVTPNHVHADVMRACIEAGKPFMAEKPFTRTYAEAVELLELYRKRPVKSMIGFSHRYHPAFLYAKELIRSGKIGTVRHLFIQYMQGWGAVKYDRAMAWRFDKKITGTGTLGDLGAHMLDLSRHLIGGVQELSGLMTTIVNERKDPATGQMVPVDVDDFASFQAVLEGGAAAVFQTSRNAVGFGNHFDITIYGDIGTLYASNENGAKQIVHIHDDTPNKQPVRELLDVPHHLYVTQWEDFVNLLLDRPVVALPTFMDGYYNQEALEMVERSANLKRTMKPEDVRPVGVQL